MEQELIKIINDSGYPHRFEKDGVYGFRLEPKRVYRCKFLKNSDIDGYPLFRIVEKIPAGNYDGSLLGFDKFKWVETLDEEIKSENNIYKISIQLGNYKTSCAIPLENSSEMNEVNGYNIVKTVFDQLLNEVKTQYFKLKDTTNG